MTAVCTVELVVGHETDPPNTNTLSLVTITEDPAKLLGRLPAALHAPNVPSAFIVAVNIVERGLTLSNPPNKNTLFLVTATEYAYKTLGMLPAVVHTPSVPSEFIVVVCMVEIGALLNPPNKNTLLLVTNTEELHKSTGRLPAFSQLAKLLLTRVGDVCI